MSGLPRGIAWLVRRAAPRRADDLVADLDEDYQRVRARKSAAHARWWLLGETVSLVVAYAVARLVRLRDLWPLWSRDVRLVWRGLGRGTLPAIGAAAMLSAGLLAVLLAAGVSRTLLFRQVSAAHGDSFRRLVVQDRYARPTSRLAYPELQAVRQHLDGAAYVTAVNLQPVVLGIDGRDEQTLAEVVDSSYFALTGTTTVVGRGLLHADDQPGAPPAIVISDPLWRNRFAASPTVLGRIVELNRQPFTVVGVARALGSSSFLGASVDAWITTAHADAILNRGWRTDLAHRWFTGFALPHASTAEVDARLATAAVALAATYPEFWRDRSLQTSPATLVSGSQRGQMVVLAVILAALALLILLTAASNVGGLLLARAAATRRHVAIHLSMGSGRAAVVRRQVMEGAVLGLGGAAFAVAGYAWTRSRLTEIAWLPTLALRLDLPFDGAVVAIVTVSGAVSGMALALGPALWATRVDLADALREGDLRTSAGRGVLQLRKVLVSAQVALSITLVVGATLVGRSLTALTSADVGFARGGLVAMDFDLEPARAAPGELPALAREALRRAAATAGVSAAAMSNRAPVDASTPSLDVAVAPGAPIVRDVTFYLATAGYFDTVGLPLVSGRPFTEDEADRAAEVAIVNETLAAALWPGSAAIDRAIYLPAESTTLRVIGVARDSRYRSLGDGSRPHLYRPTPPALGLTLLARTADDPRATLRAVQSALDETGPGLVGFFPRTFADHVAVELLPPRAAAAAAAVVGALALVLSAVGLYGLVSWFVELRRREIGVRMALGAHAGDVRWLIVRQALATALPGMIAGVFLSVSVGVFGRSFLHGVGAADPGALGAGAAAVALVVAAGSYLPGRRATRIDPIRALRDA